MAKSIIEEKPILLSPEPVIRCPKCQTEIKLTESLAKPLLEATRRDYEAKLADKEAEVVKREEAARAREQAVDQKIAETVQREREKIVADETKKAKLAAQADISQKQKELADMQEVLKQRDEKLAEAQKAQVGLLKQKRELEDAKREVELSVEKRLAESLSKAREEAKKEAEAELAGKLAESQNSVETLQKQLGDGAHRMVHAPNFEMAIFGEQWTEDKPWKARVAIAQGNGDQAALNAFFEFVLGTTVASLAPGAPVNAPPVAQEMAAG